MKITYATWTKVGNTLKIVRRANSHAAVLKGFRPANTFVTCAVHKA